VAVDMFQRVEVASEELADGAAPCFGMMKTL
jgi:hypothetical protein